MDLKTLLGSVLIGSLFIIINRF